MLTKQMQQFIAAAQPHFPGLFMRDRAEFDGESDAGIWTSGETGVFDYWQDYVNPVMQVLLNEHGLYHSWYDAGTVMICTA